MNNEGLGNEKGLGLRLQKARKAAGMTQQQLCHSASLSYSTLAKIERGAIKSPSIFTIQQIAGALKTSVDELLGSPREGSKQPKKRSKSGISFVYFDINGCLVRFFHRAFTEVSKDTGVPPDIVETTFWHYNDAVCRGEMPLEKLNNILGKQFEITSFDWAKYYLDAVDPIDETRELIAWASQHYHVGLLSNIMPGFIKTMRERNLLPDIEYDAIIDSSETGVIKPEPEIYNKAAQKAGCQPKEILLIDDSRTNLMAADKAGWRVLWFDDYRPKESVERIRQALLF